VAVHLQRQREAGRPVQPLPPGPDRGQEPPGGHDPLPEPLLLGGPGRPERGRIGLELQAAGDHLDAALLVLDPTDLGAETEAVGELGPQPPLLRVHGADEEELGPVRGRHPLAGDDVDPHGRGVEQEVDRQEEEPQLEVLLPDQGRQGEDPVLGERVARSQSRRRTR